MNYRKMLLGLMVISAASFASIATAQDSPADDTPNAPAAPTEGDAVAAPPVPGQDAAGATQQEGETDAEGSDSKPSGGFPPMLLVMVGVFALMYFWMGRSKRKQAAKRKDMLAALGKGDKVTSIGGLVGTIMEVREDEVVVKIDENNNVRVRFARWAIRGVGDDAKQENLDEKK